MREAVASHGQLWTKEGGPQSRGDTEEETFLQLVLGGTGPTQGGRQRWNFISVAHKFNICVSNRLKSLLLIGTF